MKDAQVQACRPPTKDAQVRTGRRSLPVPCSAAAADNLHTIQPSSAATTASPTTALSQAPTSSRSHDPDAPPGPFFTFHNKAAALPPAPSNLSLLIQQLRVLWVGGFPKQATRALFLAFIKRVGSQKFPRPLAISKISAATYAVAFRTRSEVQLAQRLLHNVALPKMKCKLSAAPGAWRTFRWSDLSDEVRGAWLRTGSLPFNRPVFVEMAPAPFKVCVAKEYQAEFDRITRALARLSSTAEEAARAATDARSPPADPRPYTAAPSAVSLPPIPTTSANNPSEIAPVLRKSPAAAPPTMSAMLVAQATASIPSTSAATILAQAESAPKPPSNLLESAGQGSGSAAATEGNAASASSSSSEIATLPSAAPPVPRPGPGPIVATLPAKPVAPVAPLPPRPLSSASLPARPSAPNVPQASAPPALQLPAPPVTAFP